MERLLLLMMQPSRETTIAIWQGHCIMVALSSAKTRHGAIGSIRTHTVADACWNKTMESRSGVMANWGFSTGANGYDRNDRLIAWNRSDAARDQSWTLTYEGDWDYFKDAGTTQDRAHGPAHELTAIDSTTLTYDAKGNLTTNASGDTYAWDFDNRLRTATVSGDVSTYTYDALGRRTSKEVSATKTLFVSSTQPLPSSPHAGQVMAEYSSGAAPSSPTEKHIFGYYIDEPVLKVGTGGLLYFHANDLFSIAALTDTDGDPIERYAYTAYGVLAILAADGSTVRPSSSYANPWTFTGREWDPELALYYYRARFYDPALGRFVTRDPIGDEANHYLGHRYYVAHLGRFVSRDPIEVQSGDLNLYRYLFANPSSGTDPYGLRGPITPLRPAPTYRPVDPFIVTIPGRNPPPLFTPEPQPLVPWPFRPIDQPPYVLEPYPPHLPLPPGYPPGPGPSIGALPGSREWGVYAEECWQRELNPRPDPVGQSPPASIVAQGIDCAFLELMGIPPCSGIHDPKSGTPHTSCKECNPGHNCISFGGESVDPRNLKDCFSKLHDQMHYGCAPAGRQKEWKWDSIVCGKCCFETMVDGRKQSHLADVCICQPDHSAPKAEKRTFE